MKIEINNMLESCQVICEEADCWNVLPDAKLKSRKNGVHCITEYRGDYDYRWVPVKEGKITKNLTPKN